MTPEQLKAFATMLEEKSPVAYEEIGRLVEHVKTLNTFVIDLTDWLASSPSPMKTATYYQIQARAQQLRSVIDPHKPTLSPLWMF